MQATEAGELAEQRVSDEDSVHGSAPSQHDEFSELPSEEEAEVEQNSSHDADEGEIEDSEVDGGDAEPDNSGWDEDEHQIYALIEEEIMIAAEEEGLVRRPTIAREVSKQMRLLIPSPRDRQEAQILRGQLYLLKQQGDGELLGEELLVTESELIAQILELEYMPPRSMAFRGRTIPCCCSVDQALAKIDGNDYLFAQIFGFRPNEVKTLASELFFYQATFEVERTKYSVEECMLALLARMRLTMTTFDFMEWFFQRACSTLVAMFRDTTEYFLNKYSELISPNHMSRFQPIVDMCKGVMLAKYRATIKQPGADLPARFRGVGAYMDGSKFMICRPGLNKDANVQRSFYNNKGNAHFINMLAIVLPNGLRACVTFGTGRHADPFLVSNEVELGLEYLRLPVLGDSIFGCKPYIRGMEKISKAKLSAVKSVGAAAIRIPVEWTFVEIKQNFPLTTTFTKLKLFQTRPRAIIELAVLLSNFRCCLRGENATTYFGLLPPTLADYLQFGVEPDMQ